VRLLHGSRDGDLLRLVLLDEDGHLRIAHVLLLEQPGDHPLELPLRQPGDLQPSEQRKRDRAVVRDADGLIQLLEVEDPDLEEVLAADLVVRAPALEERNRRRDRGDRDRVRLEDLGGLGRGRVDREKEEEEHSQHRDGSLQRQYPNDTPKPTVPRVWSRESSVELRLVLT